MKIYIDLFLLFNIIIDTIIIIGVSLILKRRTTIIRIIISSIIGGLSSLLIITSINKIIIEVISIIIMCLIAFKYKSIGYTIKNIIYMYVISTLLGGMLYLFNIKIDNSFLYYLVIIVISMETITLYIKEMKKIKNNYNNYYKVDIYFDKEVLSVIGFVDTGNNLYDPYKKRPIIILNKRYERDDKFILVPYNTVSGSGLLKCIRTKYIQIDGKKINDVLVGFSDNIKLSDGVDAILHKDII